MKTFDGGGQCLFIDEEFAGQLHLKVLRKAKLTINTFPCYSFTRARGCEVVEVMWKERKSKHGDKVEVVDTQNSELQRSLMKRKLKPETLSSP